MKDFYEYWDEEVLKFWCKDGEIPESQKFWFNEQRHLNLRKDLMPEPYWGDIDNNSVVFINFNPAGSEIVDPNDDSHISQKENPEKICGWLCTEYSKVAKTFPLLEEEIPVKYKGADWWKKRKEWIKQFGIEDSQVKPFAIELCPWHSKKWSGGKYKSKRKNFPELNTYIREYFGPWLERALRGSKHHVALCIGKEFAENVIPTIWPDCAGEKEYYPIKENARRFWVFKIKGLGHIICTSARGSNLIPSPEVFGQFEKKIYEEIKDSL